MIVHLFNSTLVSGPETLVIPALPSLGEDLGQTVEVWNLAELRKDSAAEKPLAYAEGFGLKTRSFPVGSRWDWSTVRTLAQTLADSKPVLVHAHDVKASLYLLLAQSFAWIWCPSEASKKRALRFTTHHGIHARNGRMVRVYEWIYRFFCLPFFDQILVVCSSDKDILTAQGLSGEKITVHLNGVDRSRVDPSLRPQLKAGIQQRWEERFQLSLKGKCVLGVAARLSPEKNHALILEALKLLKEKNQDWVCLCFGVGHLLSELKQRTETLGLLKHVVWCGYENNLSEAMAGFDLLLSVSIGEGLPINLLEAGWAATPILAARVDGVNDLVPEGHSELQQSGLPPKPTAAEVAQRLGELISNSPLRDQLGTQFQKRVEETFSGTLWKKNLKNIYFRFIPKP